WARPCCCVVVRAIAARMSAGVTHPCGSQAGRIGTWDRAVSARRPVELSSRRHGPGSLLLLLLGLPGFVAVVGAGSGEQLVAEGCRGDGVGEDDERFAVDDLDGIPGERAAAAQEGAGVAPAPPAVQRAAPDA